jgi:hypothetical protein
MPRLALLVSAWGDERERRGRGGVRERGIGEGGLSERGREGGREGESVCVHVYTYTHIHTRHTYTHTHITCSQKQSRKSGADFFIYRIPIR